MAVLSSGTVARQTDTLAVSLPNCPRALQKTQRPCAGQLQKKRKHEGKHEHL